MSQNSKRRPYKLPRQLNVGGHLWLARPTKFCQSVPLGTTHRAGSYSDGRQHSPRKTQTHRYHPLIQLAFRKGGAPSHLAHAARPLPPLVVAGRPQGAHAQEELGGCSAHATQGPLAPALMVPHQLLPAPAGRRQGAGEPPKKKTGLPESLLPVAWHALPCHLTKRSNDPSKNHPRQGSPGTAARPQLQPIGGVQRLVKPSQLKEGALPDATHPPTCPLPGQACHRPARRPGP